MLKKGVIYRQYGEFTFVRDILAHKAYLMDGCAGDILAYCEKYPNHTPAQIAVYLQDFYQQADLEDDIEQFIEQIQAIGLLKKEEEMSREEDMEDQILQQVHELCTELQVPFSAVFELTYRCSEKCIHCYIDDDLTCAKAQELTFEEYKKLCDQLRELGCMNLLLTGGEACLREDFVDIAEYAVQKGFCVDIYTNGISMSEEQFNRLIELPLNSVSFSLYSGEAEIHDAITKVPGSFQKTLLRMLMFKCAGIATYIKTVTIRQNKDYLESLYLLGQRLGIEIENSMLITPTHTGADMSSFRLGNVEDYANALRLDFQYNGSPEPCERSLDSTICACGQYVLSVDPYGTVFPCVSMPVPLGNIRQSSLAEIWFESKAFLPIRNMRFRDMSCHPQSCSHKDSCTICLGTAYKESGNQLLPPAESCQYAEALAKVLEGE